MLACQECDWGSNPSAAHEGATNFFFMLLISYLDATRTLLIKLLG